MYLKRDIQTSISRAEIFVLNFSDKDVFHFNKIYLVNTQYSRNEIFIATDKNNLLLKLSIVISVSFFQIL